MRVWRKRSYHVDEDEERVDVSRELAKWARGCSLGRDCWSRKERLGCTAATIPQRLALDP